MSRRPSVPSYGLHKATGQARVAIGGRTIYLGKYGSPESHEKYAREIAQLAMEPEPEPLLQLRDAAGYDLTVNEVLVRYLRWADQHYRWKGERFLAMHRRLLSDYLVAEGIAVQHIMPTGEVRPHTMTEGAQVSAGELTYPPPEEDPTQLLF